MNKNTNGEPEEFFENNNLDDVSQYALPEAKEIVLDLAKNTVRDTKDFAPIELIYLTAKEKGIKIKEFPIKNGLIDSGCRKSGCMGRGYKGWVGNIPIACSCIFEKENLESEGVSINRGIIRNYLKNKQKEEQTLKQSKMKELGLKQVNSNLFVKYKKGTKILLKYSWKKNKDTWNFQRLEDEHYKISSNTNVVDLDEDLVEGTI